MLYDKEMIGIALEKLCAIYMKDDAKGYADTFIDEIKILRVSKHENMTPIFYKKGFFFIGQGREVNKIKDVDTENTSTKYLIITTPQNIPSEIFVYEREPLIALHILFNENRLHKILSKLKHNIKNKTGALNSVVTSNRTKEIQDVFVRLINTMKNEEESSITGEALLDELYYRVLKDKYGYILNELATPSSSFHKLSKVIDILNKDIEKNLTVDEMAKLANMSTNTFHKTFKETMHDSPTQYVKKIRLAKAKSLMLKDNIKALEASTKVGYNSISQFSREFKRYFGVPPIKAKGLSYKEF